jgi:hypothetical protein
MSKRQATTELKTNESYEFDESGAWCSCCVLRGGMAALGIFVLYDALFPIGERVHGNGSVYFDCDVLLPQ